MYSGYLHHLLYMHSVHVPTCTCTSPIGLSYTFVLAIEITIEIYENTCN